MPPSSFPTAAPEKNFTIPIPSKKPLADLLPALAVAIRPRGLAEAQRSRQPFGPLRSVMPAAFRIPSAALRGTPHAHWGEDGDSEGREEKAPQGEGMEWQL